MPKIKVPKRDRMTREEVEEMIKKVDQISSNPLRDKALLATLYLTGARISEVLNLRKEDLWIDERKKMVFFRMRPQKRRDTSPLKHHHILGLSINAPFMNYILELADIMPSRDSWLFHGDYVYPISRVTAWRIIKKLNPNTFPHFFRHTRASILAEMGADAFEIRDWLGRKTLPEEYVRTNPQRLWSLGKRIQ